MEIISLCPFQEAFKQAVRSCNVHIVHVPRQVCPNDVLSSLDIGCIHSSHKYQTLHGIWEATHGVDMGGLSGAWERS